MALCVCDVWANTWLDSTCLRCRGCCFRDRASSELGSFSKANLCLPLLSLCRAPDHMSYWGPSHRFSPQHTFLSVCVFIRALAEQGGKKLLLSERERGGSRNCDHASLYWYTFPCTHLAEGSSSIHEGEHDTNMADGRQPRPEKNRDRVGKSQSLLLKFLALYPTTENLVLEGRYD